MKELLKEFLKDIFIGVLVFIGFMFITAIVYNFFGGFWNVFFGM